MATAILKPGQPPLRGIYCGALFRCTPNGRQLMFTVPMPSAEEVEKNPAARAEWVISECIWDIQKRMNNPAEAMKQYRAIRERIKRDYMRCYKLQPNNRKLIEAIVNAYFQDTRRRPSKQQPSMQLDLHPP